MSTVEITNRLRFVAKNTYKDYQEYSFHIGDTTSIPIWDEQLGWSQMKLRNGDNALLSIKLEPLGTKNDHLEVTFDEL